jgi:hypothetical protein
VAVPIGPITPQERRQVELICHIAYELGQVVLGQPVAQVGRQQKGLVAVAAKEAVGHDA